MLSQKLKNKNTEVHTPYIRKFKLFRKVDYFDLFKGTLDRIPNSFNAMYDMFHDTESLFSVDFIDEINNGTFNLFPSENDECETMDKEIEMTESMSQQPEEVHEGQQSKRVDEKKEEKDKRKNKQRWRVARCRRKRKRELRKNRFMRSEDEINE